MTEGEGVAVGIDADVVVAADRACEDGLREVIEEQALDGAFHGTGTELGIVAFAGEQVEGAVGEREGDAVLGEHLLHGRDLQLDNLAYLGLRQRLKHDGLIDTVEEFGSDGALEQVKHRALCLLDDRFAVVGRERILGDRIAEH